MVLLSRLCFPFLATTSLLISFSSFAPAHAEEAQAATLSNAKTPQTSLSSRRNGKICKTKVILRPHKRKVLQCVGYVHLAAPHYQVHGDAHTWWKRADEKNYARGQIPEPGAVLSFKATKKMFYGHVALVRSQEDDRTIRIDHAHWGANQIDHNTRVIDVSPNNDWTSVRVALRGNPSQFGKVYPTNGFIYPWSKEKEDEREEDRLGKPFAGRSAVQVNFRLPSQVK